ncbi:MAG: DUF3574 domain-containing protein [Bacteroidetes bacterium]|nr:MAG: DUF3574 domain-containing protein [Bacteroidota bacterium]
MKHTLFFALLPLLLFACQSSFSGSQPMLRTELYFGLTWPDGRLITQTQWQTFLDTCISPRFPAGLSVLSAQGQWQMEDGEVVQEGSRLVVLLHDPSRKAALDTIVDAYKARFNQEAVLRVSSRARVGF